MDRSEAEKVGKSRLQKPVRSWQWWFLAFLTVPEACTLPRHIPSLLIPKCTSHAYSAKEIKSNCMEGTKRVLDKNKCEDIWNNERSRSAAFAYGRGSPFCYLVLEDLEDFVSTENAMSNSDENKLEEYLRNCKDIKFYTEIDSILNDKRFEEFQSSMTANDIWFCVMNHLYVLTLQKVLPSEKLYMEHLINRFHDLELEDLWLRGDYSVILGSYSWLFSKLPLHVLERGLLIHMSRIPYKRSGKKSLAKAFKKEMLRELQKDYELLTTRIHCLPFLMYEGMKLNEIDSLVDLWKDGGYSS